MARRDSAAALLAGERRTEVRAAGGEAEMTVLPVYEMLLAQREGEALARELGAEEPLCRTAALLSRSLFRAGERLFPDARAALEALTPGEMALLGERARALNSAANPSPRAGRERVRSLREELGEDAWQRLRWRVLRTMGALPTERRVRDMTDADYLYCVLNLLLDGEEALDGLCPACRERAKKRTCRCCGADLDDGDVNESFDEERFRALAERGVRGADSCETAERRGEGAPRHGAVDGGRAR